MSDVILEVKNLKKYFKTAKGMLHAVDDVSFSLERGTTLGVVGESGCGKSTLGRSILRLIEPTSGEVRFEDKDVAALNTKEMRAMRKDMQIIFQDPYSSLDPRKTVYQAISEPIIKHKLIKDKAALEARVLVGGVYWRAISDAPLKEGELVKVTAVNGNVLTVDIQSETVKEN